MNVKMKMISLVASVALLAGVGAANAQEPLRLSENSMDTITAGSYYSPDFSFTKYVNTYVNTNLDVYKTVGTHTYVSGKLADGEAYATCGASNCLTETLTVTNVPSNYSYEPTSSYSSSISATGGSYYHY
jgi:hypothetical protein